MVNRDYSKIEKILELGKQTLDIEKIITSVKYTKLEKEVSNILHQIKEELVEDIVDIYNSSEVKTEEIQEVIPEVIPEIKEEIPEVKTTKRKITRTKK